MYAKKMNSALFKNVICSEIMYLIYMYKKELGIR